MILISILPLSIAILFSIYIYNQETILENERALKSALIGGNSELQKVDFSQLTIITNTRFNQTTIKDYILKCTNEKEKRIICSNLKNQLNNITYTTPVVLSFGSLAFSFVTSLRTDILGEYPFFVYYFFILLILICYMIISRFNRSRRLIKFITEIEWELP